MAETDINLRTKIASIVENIQPLDEMETTQRQEILDWIRSGADLFRIVKPDVPKKHLVVYFVLHDPETQSILLVDHKSAASWLPTGGHVEDGELPIEAASRECIEELGMRAKFTRDEPLLLTARQTLNTPTPHTDVSLWYVMEASQSTPLNWDSGEFHSVRWWKIEDIRTENPEQFDPNMPRFIQKLEAHAA